MGCSVHSQHARAESAPTRRRLGPLADRAGREADDRGHGVSAREAYLRPVTNYYHACLAIPVDDPGYRAGVEHYRSLFQRFAALSTPPRSCITGSDRRAWSAGTTCSCRPPGHGPEHLSRHLLPARHRGRRVAALSEGRQTVPGQAEQTARFYEGEPGHGYPRLVAEPQIIRCPLLCLNDPSDEELRRQRAPPAPGQAHISRAEWCRLSYRREPGRIVR
jgi:hypothetical protein